MIIQIDETGATRNLNSFQIETAVKFTTTTGESSYLVTLSDGTQYEIDETTYNLVLANL